LGDSKPYRLPALAAQMSRGRRRALPRAATWLNHAEDPLARAMVLVVCRAAVPGGSRAIRKLSFDRIVSVMPTTRNLAKQHQNIGI
jgi:hypothetical protein